MTPKNTYPKSLYAAAGAGELAFEKLRKLPETATKLRGKVQDEVQKIDLDDVRTRVRTEVAQLRGRLDEVRRKGATEARFDAQRFRGSAEKTVNGIVESAQRQFLAASKQVTEVYEDLAQRGEQVLNNGMPATRTDVSRAGAPGSASGKKAAPKARAASTRSTRAVAGRSTKSDSK